MALPTGSSRDGALFGSGGAPFSLGKKSVWNELCEWLRQNVIDVALVSALVTGIAIGVFGAANWNNYIRPMPPNTRWVNEQTAAAQMSDYEYRLERVGKDAVIPWVSAVTLTFFGCTVALVGGIGLARRYGP